MNVNYELGVAVMLVTRGDSWLAEQQLYVRHGDKYLHALLRTNVNIAAAGSAHRLTTRL